MSSPTFLSLRGRKYPMLLIRLQLNEGDSHSDKQNVRIYEIRARDKLWGQNDLSSNPALPFTNRVTLVKLLNLMEFQFHHLEK